MGLGGSRVAHFNELLPSKISMATKNEFPVSEKGVFKNEKL